MIYVCRETGAWGVFEPRIAFRRLKCGLPPGLQPIADALGKGDYFFIKDRECLWHVFKVTVAWHLNFSKVLRKWKQVTKRVGFYFESGKSAEDYDFLCM